MAFELQTTPEKGDLDRKLSELMHESRHKLQAAQLGTERPWQHGRTVVEHFARANEIHKEAMEQAKLIVASFIQSTGVPAYEVVGWARPHLENLNRSLIGVIPPGGVPEEYQRQAQQYGAIFTQRLDSLLRDIEIGYDTAEGFAPRAPGEAAVAASPSNWVPIKGSAGSFVDNGPRPMPRVMAEAIGSIPPQPQETTPASLTVEASLSSASAASGSATPTITPDTTGETATFIRFAESYERFGPQPVPDAVAATIQGAASSAASGTVSTELSVDLLNQWQVRERRLRP